MSAKRLKSLIGIYYLLGCLGVCMFVCIQYTSKRLNRSSPILCGTSHDPREGLWMIQFTKFCLQQNSIHEIFFNPQTFLCFCFSMFTKRKCSIEIARWDEVPWKPSIWIFPYQKEKLVCFLYINICKCIKVFPEAWQHFLILDGDCRCCLEIMTLRYFS